MIFARAQYMVWYFFQVCSVKPDFIVSALCVFRFLTSTSLFGSSTYKSSHSQGTPYMQLFMSACFWRFSWNYGGFYFSVCLWKSLQVRYYQCTFGGIIFWLLSKIFPWVVLLFSIPRMHCKSFLLHPRVSLLFLSLWIVDVWLKLEILSCVCRYSKYRCSESPVLSILTFKNRIKPCFLFTFYCELCGWSVVVLVVQKVPQFVVAMLPNGESVFLVPK